MVHDSISNFLLMTQHLLNIIGETIHEPERCKMPIVCYLVFLDFLAVVWTLPHLVVAQ